MSVDKISAKVQGWQWASSTPLNEVNFFSDAARTAITAEIDLEDYIVEFGKLQYRFDSVDNMGANGSGNLWFEAGSITVKVTDGEIGGLKMSEFFKIFEDTTYIKYAGKIYYDGDLLFQFVVNQDGLKERFAHADSSSHQIEVMLVSVQKEMKDWYSTVNLIHADSLAWTNLGVGQIGDYEIFYMPINDLLADLFPSNIFQSEIVTDPLFTILNVAKHPRFCSNSLTGGLWFTKNGYERFQTNGMTRWEWLETICNSMAWVFFFWEDKFYIRNRVSAELPVTEIDYELIHEEGYEIGKSKPRITYDYIFMPTGSLYSGFTRLIGSNQLSGERAVILTNKDTITKDTNHFNTFVDHPLAYQIGHTNGYKFSRVFNEDDDTKRMVMQTYTAPPLEKWTDELRLFKKDKLLILKTGNSGAERWLARFLATEGKIDGPYTATSIPDDSTRMLFTGCAGDQLFTKLGTTMTQNYSGLPDTPGFIHTLEFEKSYAKYLDSRSNIYNTVKNIGLHISPFNNLKFVSSGDVFFDNAIWGIQLLELDLIQETTEHELVKVN